MTDTRTKEQLKADGDYTPRYWQQLKTERGWSTTPHGQRNPSKRRQSTVEKARRDGLR
jgi:hypothetical protein